MAALNGKKGDGMGKLGRGWIAVLVALVIAALCMPRMVVAAEAESGQEAEPVAIEEVLTEEEPAAEEQAEEIVLEPAEEAVPEPAEESAGEIVEPVEDAATEEELPAEDEAAASDDPVVEDEVGLEEPAEAEDSEAAEESAEEEEDPEALAVSRTPGNTRASAPTIPLNTNISANGMGYFKFTLPKDGYIVIERVSGNMGSGYELISVPSASEAVLYSETDHAAGGLGLSRSLKIGLSASRTFYLKVAYSNAKSYTFKINYTQRSDWEYKDKPLSAGKKMTPGTFFNGFVDDGYKDEGYFTFTLSKAMNVSLTLRHKSTDPHDNDLRFEVYAINGHANISSGLKGSVAPQKTGTSNTKKLDKGTYLVRVYSDDSRESGEGHEGAYYFQVRLNTKEVKQSTAPWERIAGKNALKTMQKVVQKDFSPSNTDTVIVAASGTYKDALTASALAGKYDAPILLTKKGSLSAETKAEITRLKPMRVIVVGGEKAVPAKVYRQLDALPTVKRITRVAGRNAAATSREVAKKVGGASGWVIIATSRDFADALSIAPWAYANKAPIILTTAKGNLSDESLKTIRQLGVKKALIVGGEKAVTRAAERRLEKAGLTVTRRGGANAIETSRLIAAWELGQGFSLKNIAVATRAGYKDALTGSALMGRLKGPVLLVSGKDRFAVDYLKGRMGQVKKAYVLGGPSAVSAGTWNYCLALK